MSKAEDFITRYFATYLAECRVRNPFFDIELSTPIPPSTEEIEEAMAYLIAQGVEPLIIGTFAIVKHLNLSDAEIRARSFRPTYVLEILVFDRVPMPPPNWQVKIDSSGKVAWCSATGGQINFWLANETFPEEFVKAKSIGRDPESILFDCPVADVKTLFILNLNSTLEVELGKLMTLTRKTKIPEEIEKDLWSNRQKKNLELLKIWAKLRLKDTQTT